MKYDVETTAKIVADYQAGILPIDIAAALTLSNSEKGTPEVVPERSVIAKLSSLGVYKKKEYLNKRGNVPVKKEEYIDRIAALLEVNSEILESLEKVNKAVLALIAERLTTSGHAAAETTPSETELS